MSDNLATIPNDIWPEILKRIPPKNLSQLRCVSKSFNTLISSPSFITTHIKFTQTHLLFIHITQTHHSRHEHFTLANNSLTNPFHNSLDLGYPPVKPYLSKFRIVGSINGLVCLVDDFYPHPDKESIILWNPLVCKYVDLSRDRVRVDDVSVVGFGFDEKKNDYKVVHLRYLDSGKGYDVVPPKVEVFSVRERVWKSVRAGYVCCCVVELFWSQCFLNGAIHWMAYEQGGRDRRFSNNLFLLFDVVEEKFKKMKFPSALVETCPVLLSVTDLKGELAVMEYQMKGGERNRCNVWVKKDYKVGSSWSKMFSVELEGWLGEVLMTRENGKLFGVTRDGWLVSYDTNKKCMDKVVHGWSQGFYVGDYTPSLVLLDKESGASSYAKTKATHSKNSGAEGGKRKWSGCDERTILTYEETKFGDVLGKLRRAFFDVSEVF